MSESKQQQEIMPLPYVAGPGERLFDGGDCWVIDCEQGSVAEMMCPANQQEKTAQFLARAADNYHDLIRWLTSMACPQCKVHMSYETYKGCQHCRDARKALLALAEKES